MREREREVEKFGRGGEEERRREAHSWRRGITSQNSFMFINKRLKNNESSARRMKKVLFSYGVHTTTAAAATYETAVLVAVVARVCNNREPLWRSVVCPK